VLGGGRTAWMYIRTDCEKAMIEAMSTTKLMPMIIAGSISNPCVMGSSFCSEHKP
jgi:hypothetical protein